MILFFSRSLNLLLYCFFFYSTGGCIGCISVALDFKYRLLNRNFLWNCVYYIMLHSSALNLKSGWRNLQNLINQTKATQLGSTFMWCCFIMECARVLQGGVKVVLLISVLDDFLVWQFKWMKAPDQFSIPEQSLFMVQKLVTGLNFQSVDEFSSINDR